MIATVVLCVVSTLTFCLCSRVLIAFAGAKPVSQRLGSAKTSVRARRVGRQYLVVSFAILTAFSFVGAVQSFIELFYL